MNWFEVHINTSKLLPKLKNSVFFVKCPKIANWKIKYFEINWLEVHINANKLLPKLKNSVLFVKGLKIANWKIKYYEWIDWKLILMQVNYNQS